jgi:glycerol-1-phosphate dehydrogenase [NAD(P)+]
VERPASAARRIRLPFGTDGTAPGPPVTGPAFTTVFGRGLVGELQLVAHRPYLVVTMDDLWPAFEGQLGEHLAGVYRVTTLDLDQLVADAEALPAHRSIIGLGGGQASDVAKFFTWSRGAALFQVPTAMTTNAPFSHRPLLRDGGRAVAIGYAVPEAVYVDFDVIRSAPPLLNRSGACDVLCYHTAHYDWKLAHELGKDEARWPYDPSMVAEARQSYDAVYAALDDIRDVNDAGIRALMLAHRWGGAAFHNAGWNARHMDGVDHAFLYCLENVTGHHFIHGQAVGLGIYLGSELQDNEPEAMLATLHRTGVDIRPEAMGVSWDDVATAMRRLGSYVRFAEYWFTVADVRPVTDGLLDRARERLYATFGTWEA